MSWHIWIDECMPKSFREGLIKCIEQGRHSKLSDHIKWQSVDDRQKSRGDVRWFQNARREAGNNRLMIITQDCQIRKRRHEHEALLKYCEVAIFLMTEEKHGDATLEGVIEAVANALADRIIGKNRIQREIDISLKPPHKRTVHNGKIRKA
jgi:hypothetical protein